MSDADQKLWRKAQLFDRCWGKEYIAKTEAEADVLAHVDEYIHKVSTESHDGNGLLLVGPPGTGKTLLAHRVLWAAINEGYSARAVTLDLYLRWHKDLMELSKLLGKDDASTERWMLLTNTIRDIRVKYDFVLLDDVDKIYLGATSWARVEFTSLVRTRGNDKLPMIITTNSSYRDISKVFGDAMSSYLKEVCEVVVVATEDHR